MNQHIPTGPRPEPPHSPADQSAETCPACLATVAGAAGQRCDSCGIDLRHPAVGGLRDIERRWQELAGERHRLLAELVATRVAVAQAAAVPTGVITPPPPPMGPPYDVPHPRSRRWHVGVPALLAFAGVALITAAAAVFTAMAWTALPALGQAAILVAVTGLATASALLLERRQLHLAAGALGVLTMLLVGVNVVGLERTGLFDLAAFATPVIGTIAAAVGWGLSRAGLRWVSTAGALATLIALVGCVEAIATAVDVSEIQLVILSVALSVVAAATTVAWRSIPARRITAGGAVVWLTFSGLIGAVGVAQQDIELVAGIGVVALTVGLLLGGARWTAWTLAPAVLLVTAIVLAAIGQQSLDESVMLAGAGLVVAVVAWASTRLSDERRTPTLVGLLPATALTVAGVIGAMLLVIERIAATIGRFEWVAVDVWLVTSVVLAGVALLAVPRMRASAPWVAAPVLIVLAGALPAPYAWLLLGMAAIVGGVAHAMRSWDPLIMYLFAVMATGLAADQPWGLAVTATVTAGLAAWSALRSGSVRVRVSGGVAVAAAGLAGDSVARALQVTGDFALAVGLLTLLAVSLVFAVRKLEDRALVAPIVAAIGTIIISANASSPRAAGLLLITGAAGWLALAIANWWHARWIAPLAASMASLVLVTDTAVDFIEVYTLGSAALLGAMGIWWLVANPSTRTVTGLSPGLIVGLVPSLLVVTGDPNQLARPLVLAFVALVLMVAGMRRRWLAPMLAGAVAAIWVAATQVWVVASVAPRWITFAFVGIVLVWLAATYEHQQVRMSALVHRFAEFR